MKKKKCNFVVTHHCNTIRKMMWNFSTGNILSVQFPSKSCYTVNIYVLLKKASHSTLNVIVVGTIKISKEINVGFLLYIMVYKWNRWCSASSLCNKNGNWNSTKTRIENKIFICRPWKIY